MDSTADKRESPYSIRLKPDLREALERQASKENRTLANMIETILTDAMKNEGQRNTGRSVRG